MTLDGWLSDTRSFPPVVQTPFYPVQRLCSSPSQILLLGVLAWISRSDQLFYARTQMGCSIIPDVSKRGHAQSGFKGGGQSAR
jgi:hypothetical protein